MVTGFSLKDIKGSLEHINLNVYVVLDTTFFESLCDAIQGHCNNDIKIFNN